MDILCYLFLTLADAVLAQNTADAHYGYPKRENDVTLHWVDVRVSVINSDTLYYIPFDESLVVLFGQPEKINITKPDIN